MQRISLAAWVCFAVLSGLLGCNKETQTDASAVAIDAGTGSSVDPALARAVAQASAGRPQPGAPRPNQAGGPPPQGVFEPNMADKELAAGAPPKIVFGNEGSAPRVSLAPLGQKPGVKRNAKLEVELQTGARPLPPIAISVSMTTQKSEQPAEPSAAPSALPVTVAITNARLDGGAGVPPELSRSFAQLNGSRFAYRLLPGGAASDFKYELAKGAEPGLDNALRAVAGTLSTNALPVPDKPVGAGGFWMVTSRETLGGLETISYRMYKVERTEPTVVLNVTTKRYATDKVFKMAGVEADTALTLEELDYSGQGTVELGAGEVKSSELVERLVASLVPASQPTQRATVQFQSRVKYAPAP